jgi:hypothetical protein
VVSFIGGRNRSTMRKTLTCCITEINKMEKNDTEKNSTKMSKFSL